MPTLLASKGVTELSPTAPDKDNGIEPGYIDMPRGATGVGR